MRAISSRLAPDPFSAKAVFAVSSKRARLRSASALGLRTAAGSSSSATPQIPLDKPRASPYLKRRHSPLTPNHVGGQWFAGAASGAFVDEGDCYSRTSPAEVHHT